MKRIITIMLSCSALLSTACNEEKKVPAKVKAAFSEKYPKAIKVDWEQEENTEWEAEFKLENTEYSAKFTENGQWLETESELEIDRLPKVIHSAITKKYPNHEIEEVELLNSPTFQNAYEVEIESEESELEIVINAN